jgi:hypothetical protein
MTMVNNGLCDLLSPVVYVKKKILVARYGLVNVVAYQILFSRLSFRATSLSQIEMW